MKIQPIEYLTPEEYFSRTRSEPPKPPAAKSRLKRLFERQFLRIPSEKVNESTIRNASSKNNASVSVCLDTMVQNFIEEDNDENHYGIHGYSSDDESSRKTSEMLKSLVLRSSNVDERNLLADTEKIGKEANENIDVKDDSYFNMSIVNSLFSQGYNASICKSQWDKSASSPAGEYEYIDVILNDQRLIIEVDFKSKFEIARPTKYYRTIIQTLPYIFVGRAESLRKIIRIVSEAARQSFKKRDMHFPPWRKAEYVEAKWFSPYTRLPPASLTPVSLAVPPSELKPIPDARVNF